MLCLQIEKDEQYIKMVVRLAGMVEGLVKSNNAIDIYEEYFPEVLPAPLAELAKSLCMSGGRSRIRMVWCNSGLPERASHSVCSKCCLLQLSSCLEPFSVCAIMGHQSRWAAASRALQRWRSCTIPGAPSVERTTSPGTPMAPAASLSRMASW